jgi:hypothetical protein
VRRATAVHHASKDAQGAARLLGADQDAKLVAAQIEHLERMPAHQCIPVSAVASFGHGRPANLPGTTLQLARGDECLDAGRLILIDSSAGARATTRRVIHECCLFSAACQSSTSRLQA